MGTIAARDCLRVLELTEQVAAAHIIACTQAVRLRLRDGGLKEAELGQRVGDFVKETADHVPFIDEDAPLDKTLRGLEPVGLAWPYCAVTSSAALRRRCESTSQRATTWASG